MTAPRARILWLDLARTAALICMIIFHFCYDLAIFGIIAAETVIAGPMRVFAICIAGSFIALAGVSLQVSHGAGIRWNSFWRRFVVLATAAIVISVATYIWVPSSFIFFGILHAIALFSLTGLAFLMVSPVITTITACAVLFLPFLWAHPFFDSIWLQWTGLGVGTPSTLDYEPVFPWFAAFLAGMTAGKLMQGTQLLSPSIASRPLHIMSTPGRYSLWVYLAHQPILIALIWTTLQVI